MRVRREVLGDDHADRATEGCSAVTEEFQDLITRYAWGEIWARPGLDRRTRSCHHAHGADRARARRGARSCMSVRHDETGWRWTRSRRCCSRRRLLRRAGGELGLRDRAAGARRGDVGTAEHSQSFRVAWVDTDASGRIHFTAAFRWAEATETSLYRELGLIRENSGGLAAAPGRGGVPPSRSCSRTRWRFACGSTGSARRRSPSRWDIVCDEEVAITGEGIQSSTWDEDGRLASPLRPRGSRPPLRVTASLAACRDLIASRRPARRLCASQDAAASAATSNSTYPLATPLGGLPWGRPRPGNSGRPGPRPERCPGQLEHGDDDEDAGVDDRRVVTSTSARTAQPIAPETSATGKDGEADDGPGDHGGGRAGDEPRPATPGEHRQREAAR